MEISSYYDSGTKKVAQKKADELGKAVIRHEGRYHVVDREMIALSQEEKDRLLYLAMLYSDMVGFFPAPGALWSTKETQNYRRRLEAWQTKLFGNIWYRMDQKRKDLSDNSEMFFINCQSLGFEEALKEINEEILREIVQKIKI